MSEPTLGHDLDRPVRVTLLNDYEIIVAGLVQLLEPYSHIVEVVETEVGGVPDEPTDVALFDTFAGRRQALSRISEMAANDAIDKVVLYTWDVPSGFAADVEAAEIDGVIMKSAT
ncbi:MAG: hypothetical protein HKN41_13620, partial [Ilumatobacter sp.]|nr:hypothetical protein [Ilumatobacter sp.]